MDKNVHCIFYIFPVALFWLDVSENIQKNSKEKHFFFSKCREGTLFEFLR